MKAYPLPSSDLCRPLRDESIQRRLGRLGRRDRLRLASARARGEAVAAPSVMGELVLFLKLEEDRVDVQQLGGEVVNYEGER